MSKKVVKTLLTESSFDLLCQSMPWGITDSKFIFGLTKSEKGWLSNKQKELREKELLKAFDIPIGKETISRYVLTRTGIEAFLNSLESGCPLKQLLDVDKLSIRNGKKAEEVHRWSKITDIQTFLYSAGVENIFTAFYDYEQNPFAFGFIKPFSLKNPTLAECSINLMQEHISNQNAAFKTIPPCSSQNNLVLFLPNKCNPMSRVIDQNNTVIRSHNNSVGILLDYINKNAYIAFKATSKKTIEWRPTAYRTFGSRMSSFFRKWKFTNVSGGGDILSAIIFCETKGEIESKAKLYKKFYEPYTHVYPVLMKREGLDQITAMINYGEAEYLERKEREVLSKIVGSYQLKGRTPMFGLGYENKPLYVGTTLDFAAFNFLEKRFANNSPIYVACYEKQKHFYTEILRLPEDYVLTVLE